jgi:hypothetical protein
MCLWIFASAHWSNQMSLWILWLLVFIVLIWWVFEPCKWHFYRGFSKHLYSEVWFQPVIWEEYNVDYLGFISPQLLVAATFFVPSKWNETFLARTVKHHSSKVWLQLVQQFQRRWLIIVRCWYNDHRSWKCYRFPSLIISTAFVWKKTRDLTKVVNWCITP